MFSVTTLSALYTEVLAGLFEAKWRAAAADDFLAEAFNSEPLLLIFSSDGILILLCKGGIL